MISNRTIAILFAVACALGILPAIDGVAMMIDLAGDRHAGYGIFPFLAIPFILSGFILFVGYLRAIDAPLYRGRRLWLWSVVYNAICVLFAGFLFITGAISNAMIPFFWDIVAVVLAIIALRATQGAIDNTSGIGPTSIDIPDDEEITGAGSFRPGTIGNVTAIVTGWLIVMMSGRTLQFMGLGNAPELGPISFAFLYFGYAVAMIAAGYLAGAIARQREVAHALVIGIIGIVTIRIAMPMHSIASVDTVLMMACTLGGLLLGGYLRMLRRRNVEAHPPAPEEYSISAPSSSRYRRIIATGFTIAGMVGLLPCGYGFYVTTQARSDFSITLLLFWLFLLIGLVLYAGYIRIALGKQTYRYEKQLWIGTIIYNALCVLAFGYISTEFFMAIAAVFWDVMAVAFGWMALNDLKREKIAAEEKGIRMAEP